MAAAAPPLDFASGDHYAVLGVPRGAGEAELKRAYKSLARRYHPDKHAEGKEAAELSFKRIADAYAVLRDPARRREYDVSGGSQSYVSYEEAEHMWRAFCQERGEDDAEGLPAAVPPDLEARRKAMGLLLAFAMLVAAPRTVMQLLPGFTAALVAVALLSRREQASRWAWCALALLLAGYAAPWALRLRAGPAAAPLDAAPPGGLAPEDRAPLALGAPHSGEEVMLGGGAFVRVADPRHRGAGEPQVEEGWQQRLLTSMTTALRGGREQVLMVFSREGCPWCDRQLPVLQEAIRRRGGSAPMEATAGEEGQEGEEEEEAGEESGGRAPPPEAAERPAPPPEAAGQAAFLWPGGEAGRAAVGAGAAPPRGGALVGAPLRVFVFDAGEFPALAQTFRVEAFPTTIAWGSPGVTPMAAQGYLDHQDLDKLLHTVATAVPAPPPSSKKSGRRGLFR